MRAAIRKARFSNCCRNTKPARTPMRPPQQRLSSADAEYQAHNLCSADSRLVRAS